ncbi:MAG: phosphoglycerate kinase [Candidatus Marinimicrobia bacterium]|nr:phosphoglycerate kinase [Candidatus Neomarinimicrobiota bacterium]
MKSIEKLTLKGQRVLIRVDFNVPLDDGIVDNDFRIRAALPTLRHCIEQNASVVLMSHLGRPNGHRVPESSLLPIAEDLETLLERDIIFSQDCISDEAVDVSRGLEPGQVHLLENLRFYPGEETNDPDFAARLANHGTVYINDAFGTAHRAHASNVGVVAHFDQAGIGLLMAREVQFLKEQLDNPKRPYVVVLGGAKIADKLELVHKLLAKADRLVIGGGMAFTFLKAQGKNVGRSLVDESLIEEAGKILEAAKSQGVEIFLPRDVVAADQISKDAAWRVVALSDLRPDEMGVDIGPETCTEFGMALAGARTILWNGPMGVFEYAPFQTGTQLVIDTIIEATSQGAISVVGGGDSASAIDKLSKAKYFTHISTGGGASLELVGGHTLPALEALS